MHCNLRMHVKKDTVVCFNFNCNNYLLCKKLGNVLTVKLLM